MSVQTRSHNGDLNHFDSVAEAFQAYKKDNTIEKISWDSPVAGSDKPVAHRFRPLTKKQLTRWQKLSVQKIRQLFSKFDNILDSTILWVDQTVGGTSWIKLTGDINTQCLDKMSKGMVMEEAIKWRDDEFIKLKIKFPTEKNYEEWNDAECIKEVLTEESFEAKYCR